MTSDPGGRRGRPSRLRLSGWRKTAVVNTAVILVVFLALLACLALSLARTGGLNQILVLYDGNCEKSRQINLLLHLATNIISTIILASSNFFMQVLTSPSREEVDQAHAEGRSLDIGVQSLMNFGKLRKRKLISWALFVLGSLPLHVFANSVIFGTDDGRSSYYALYATESFVQGGQYFPLGAGLTPDRRTPFRDYLNPSSSMSRVIEKAAREAAGWERLDLDDCFARYLNGMPIHDRHHVVMIVDSRGSAGGWTTEDLWNFNSTQAEAAAAYVPSDQLNTLLSTQGGRANDNIAPPFLNYGEGPSHLSVTLGGRLLYDAQSDIFGRRAEPGYTDYSLDDLLSPDAPTTFPVRYCLSEPLASNCKVAVSLPILLIVVITTLIKFSQCAFVLAILRHENPLVTLGDAVESFLDRQDPWTRGCCTYGWRDFRSRGSAVVDTRAAGGGAREWRKKKHRWGAAVPGWLQAVYCSVMLAVLGGAAGLYYMTDPFSPYASSNEVFGPGPDNPLLAENHLPHGSVVLSALIANSPQVILSVCYLLYNTLFTRFLLAREWGLMSTAFRGLRVTEPKGQQISTWWLQLPVLYALPLMAVSALMHWLVSSCLYMMVGTGEWYGHIKNRTGVHTGASDIPGEFIGVGYSGQALRIILIVGPVLLLVPVLMSIFCRIPGNATLVGSNSRAISAGCQARGSEEGEGLLQKGANCRSDVVPADENVRGGGLSVRKLKWGVVGSEAPSHGGGRGPDGLPVEHLTFQSEGDGVSEPVDGRWYA